MFPPLCPRRCRNRSACACWRWCCSCSPTPSSSRPSSPSWPCDARASRPWSAGATGRLRPCRARCKIFTGSDLLNWSANRVVGMLGIKGTTAELDRIHSPEEIRMLVAQSRKTGRLDADDARLLEGVFEFSEKTAREVMTPRTEMVALPVDLTLEEAADQVAVAGRSRYPVYAESLDDIVGLVHSKDILAGLRSAKGGTLRAVLRPAVFVPGTREVEDVLADMKRQKIHLAIVLDEFGGTAGLVTMEDLLEEIVGQIYDEYDRPSGETYTVPGEGAPVLSGAMPLRDVNQIYGLGLDEGSYTTIGGYLFGTLGRLPKVGDRVTVRGAAFEIVEMEGRRVGAARLLQQVAGEGTTP